MAKPTQLSPKGNPVYSLYAGTIQLEFDEEKHQYFANGEYVPSVTGVTKYLDKSGPLMYWAVKKTVEYFKEQLKPGIVVDELQLKTILKEAQTRFRAKKEEAADIGTMVHGWIEKYILSKIHNTNTPDLPINERIKKGIEAFIDWESKSKVKYLLPESKIYSKKHGYSGTCDLVCEINGKLSVVDFKTGSGPYYEHVIQTAAYQQALEEEHNYKFKERWIIKVSKDNGEFETHRAKLYKEDFNTFKALLIVYSRHLLGVLDKQKPKQYWQYN